MGTLTNWLSNTSLYLKYYERSIHPRFIRKYARQELGHEQIYQRLIQLAGDRRCDKEQGRIGDLACGTGWYSRALAQDPQRQQWRIVGLDLSPRAVAFARQKAKEILSPAEVARVRYEIADLAKGDLTAYGEFDELWLCGAIHQIPDAAEALRQVSAMLAAHGNVMVQTFLDHPDIDEAIDRAALAKFGHRIFDSDEWAELLAGAGFAPVAAQQFGLVHLTVLGKKAGA
ncbi:class I SAM-dependent methyltransferase [Corynebacterium canis]|uniref:Class I SAM-dependent methyltransferase n=1 Tax=Corynebacterium canis TaxID=679663 RepID=A0A5C5UIW8_9CORY|nr:class I SAM-dependent methyltransferase [Corynebacterium canis]TWT25562.1 class I SAM-dependent methyltransferase [Corynebacterium canis]WJY74094.1 ubiquinone/menaquinone biosynthesis methyltransferase [Corynebacterium canis]